MVVRHCAVAVVGAYEDDVVDEAGGVAVIVVVV